MKRRLTRQNSDLFKDVSISFPFIGKTILPYSGEEGRTDLFTFKRGIK